MANLACPRCGAHCISACDTKKKFSVGKAIGGNVVGGVLFGPVGAAVGIAAGLGGKKGKTTFVCQNCGNVFEQKI